MYFKLEDTRTTYFDIDDTLVLWNCPPEEGEEYIIVKLKSFSQNLVPHKENIKALKEAKDFGNRVVVWSQGGSDWAEAVILELGLENYVDAIITKPEQYYDDLHCSQFMGTNTWIKPNRKQWIF